MMTRSRPGNRAAGTFRPLSVLFIFGAALVLGIALGWQLTQSGLSTDDENPGQLRQALAEAEERAQAAGQELEALRTRSEVDRQSLELVRREMVAQKKYSTELEDDLRFYRSLMSPQTTKGQVRIGAPEFMPGKLDRHYSYRVVIHQEAEKHQIVRGRLEAEIHGAQDGELASYTFAELGVPGVDEWPEAKFRYFQEYAGEIVLPPGFEPRQIELTVRASKPRKIEVSTEYPWDIQEQSGDVGQ